MPGFADLLSLTHGLVAALVSIAAFYLIGLLLLPRRWQNSLWWPDVPALVMHGDDDQIVPYADSGPLSAKLLRNGTLKTYRGFPHGMPTTQAETINADLLDFLRA